MPMPPKVDPVRRNARIGPRKLPADGRREPAPRWPLADVLSTREIARWEELWKLPQAIAWEQLGYTAVVARYVRFALAAEAMNKDAMSEARQLEDRLGLTPKAMRLLLWEIASDEVVEKRDTTSVRGRLRAVG